MSRLRLFQIRFVASASLLLLVFMVTRLLWYPDAYFDIFGVSRQLWILVGVVIVVGPVLSAVIYKPGKKSLVMDLGILAAVELAVLVAALMLIFEGRPYFVVFAVDRFEAVAQGEVSGPDVLPALIEEQKDRKLKLVFAPLPEDPDKLTQLIKETVLEGMADIDRRPEFWRPYAEGISTIKAAALPLEALLGSDEPRSAAVSKWLADSGGSAQEYIYLPLRGKAGDAMIVLDADTAVPVATLSIDPW